MVGRVVMVFDFEIKILKTRLKTRPQKPFVVLGEIQTLPCKLLRLCT